MATFSATNQSKATVQAPREKIWEVLTDPEALPRLTPFLKKVVVDGDDWRWELSKIPILTTSFAPSFTEKMTFDEPERIEFTHSPPSGTRERAGVDGWYSLKEDSDSPADATELEIRLDVSVDLPLGKVMGPAVRSAMQAVMASMGERFAKNLLRELKNR